MYDLFQAFFENEMQKFNTNIFILESMDYQKLTRQVFDKKLFLVLFVAAYANDYAYSPHAISVDSDFVVMNMRLLEIRIMK